MGALMQRRRESRIPVEILSRYRTGSGCAHSVQVSDLSRTGCMLIQNYSALPVGKHLTIRLDNIGPIEAVVRWHDGKHIGIEFSVPLHPSMMDNLAQRFQLSEGSGRGWQQGWQEGVRA